MNNNERGRERWKFETRRGRYDDESDRGGNRHKQEIEKHLKGLHKIVEMDVSK
jgi:hypothetical protein